MATPAFKRPDDPDDGNGDQAQGETGMPVGGELAAHSTSELIALRDRLLEECLELEAGGGGDTADTESVRIQIDEIHQELALRDLAERVGSANQLARAAAGTPGGDSRPGPAPAVRSAQSAFRILDAIERRSQFMDELAQAAREQGRLDQAAAFALNAQKLDLERVEVLRNLSTMGADNTGAKE